MVLLRVFISLSLSERNNIAVIYDSLIFFSSFRNIKKLTDFLRTIVFLSTFRPSYDVFLLIIIHATYESCTCEILDYIKWKSIWKNRRHSYPRWLRKLRYRLSTSTFDKCIYIENIQCLYVKHSEAIMWWRYTRNSVYRVQYSMA